MKQLVLDLRPDTAPTLENFVVGANAELLATLARLAAATEGQAPLPHLYLWGGAGSGRVFRRQPFRFLPQSQSRQLTCDANPAEAGSLGSVAPLAGRGARRLDDYPGHADSGAGCLSGASM